MPSIFSRIISGEIPCHKIGEDQDNFAFLDIHPLRRGHTLVIPKKEVDRLFDLTDEEYLSLFHFAKKVAAAIKEVFPCDRVGLCVIGLEVPHAHIHLIPIDRLSDMDFTRPKLDLKHEELAQIAHQISSNL